MFPRQLPIEVDLDNLTEQDKKNKLICLYKKRFDLVDKLIEFIEPKLPDDYVISSAKYTVMDISNFVREYSYYRNIEKTYECLFSKVIKINAHCKINASLYQFDEEGLLYKVYVGRRDKHVDLTVFECTEVVRVITQYGSFRLTANDETRISFYSCHNIECDESFKDLIFEKFQNTKIRC